MPPAPGVFSGTTVWPARWLAAWARARNSTSVVPPGAQGMRRRIGRLGKPPFARAGAASAAAPKARALRRVRRGDIRFLLAGASLRRVKPAPGWPVPPLAVRLQGQGEPEEGIYGQRGQLRLGRHRIGRQPAYPG